MSKSETWSLPGSAYLSERWLSTDASGVAVVDPEDGSLLGHVHLADVDEMLDAIGGVESSLDEDWPLWARREALERASALVREESDRFAAIIASESSKTIREAQNEVKRAAETLRLSASAAHLLEGHTLPLADTARGADKLGWNRREPLGVIAAITPFNDPLNLVAHKVGPCLIAGNGIVLKPSKETPYSALALVDVLLRAGVPAGRVAVSVSSREAGTALVSDARIAAVSFTGGPATGDIIARAAGARKILMELGGNNGVIVCDDADVASAAEKIVDGAFGVAGQNCLSVQRVFAHESVCDRLVDLVTQGASELVVGSKHDSRTDIGPMITEREAQRVEAAIADAVAQGAVVTAGGTREGTFVAPTVLTNVPADSLLLRDEIFGPVVLIEPFSSLDDAVRQLNDTDYGLQAGVFTASLDTAMRVTSQLRVGTALVNETSDFRIDSMPFGGSKRSGVGREGVFEAVLEMSAPKNIIMSLAV